MAQQVYYSGQVQGVGFRATVASLARRYPGIRGWVRNLADGRVELLADGPQAIVAEFLEAIHDRMGNFIESIDVFERDADAEIVGFSVVG